MLFSLFITLLSAILFHSFYRLKIFFFQTFTIAFFSTTIKFLFNLITNIKSDYFIYEISNRMVRINIEGIFLTLTFLDFINSTLHLFNIAWNLKLPSNCLNLNIFLFFGTMRKKNCFFGLLAQFEFSRV